MVSPGTVIGERYRIVRLVGSGGMASVYEAEHLTVGRRVAVKVLKVDGARDAEIVGRFEREARAAAAVGHDNIVEVLDFGQHRGMPYLVMEFLAGESLAERLTHLRALPLPMAVHVMDQVLSALGAVHAAGIIHRDLKPENVHLITKAGIKDFVKLLDFGVSKFKPVGTAVVQSHTRTGVVMGTPHYMAPEQAKGSRDIDHRVDIYAAGVLLYEMVTGALPFDGDNPADLLLAIAYHRPPPRPPRAHAPALPEALDAAVMKAIAYHRGQRYESAEAFREALRPFLPATGLSVEPAAPASAPPPPAVPSRPRAERDEDAFATQETPVPLTRRSDPGARRTPAPAAVRAEPDDEADPLGVTMPAIPEIEFGPTVGPPRRPPPPPPKPAAAPTAPTSTAPTSVAPPKRRALWIALATAGAGAVVVGAVAIGLSLNPARTTTARPLAGQPAHVRVDLQNVPADATVLVDGAPEARRGLAFVRGTRHTIRVTAPAREPFETTFVAERDLGLVIALVPRAADERVAAPDAGAAAEDAAPPAPAGDVDAGRAHRRRRRGH